MSTTQKTTHRTGAEKRRIRKGGEPGPGGGGIQGGMKRLAQAIAESDPHRMDPKRVEKLLRTKDAVEPVYEVQIGEPIPSYRPRPAYRQKGLVGPRRRKEKPPMARVKVEGRIVILERGRVAQAKDLARKAWQQHRRRKASRVARQARKINRRKRQNARIDYGLIRGRQGWGAGRVTAKG